jgi:polysaccharide chain length determinant protein (PEP-CTERM system associated)
MPGEGEDYYVRLQVEITKLQGLNDQLNVARNRRAELQRQVEGEEPVFGLLVPSDDKSQMVTSPQDRQVAQFEAQLTELRLKYTETHPDIVAIKRTIEAIQAEKEQKAKAAGPATRAYSPLDLNPVYQQMKIQLFKVDVELAQLQAEYSNQSAVVSGLRRKVDTVPAIEAELKRLTRDYDVTKTQYSELLRRVESARLSEDAEQSKDDITFRVIDPPTVPSLPSGPDRGQLIAGVMVLAILAAAALALGLNLTRPVFYTGKDLERRFGVPVLGTVRLVRDDGAEAAARKGATLVIAAMAGLVVVFGLLQLFGVAPIATEATPGAGSLLTLGL